MRIRRSRNSSTSNWQRGTSDHQNRNMRHHSFLSKRKMENYAPSKTTDASMVSLYATNTRSPSSLISSPTSVALPFSLNLTFGGGTIMFASKKATNIKQPSK